MLFMMIGRGTVSVSEGDMREDMSTFDSFVRATARAVTCFESYGIKS